MVVYKEDSPTAAVDELGVRRSIGGSGSPTPAKGRSSLPAPSGKPLAHVRFLLSDGQNEE